MTDLTWIKPDWPAPPNVHAVISTRLGPGISIPPYDRFNLGSRCGDDPAAVEQNRSSLREALNLPNTPVWLRQVHGTTVYKIDKISLDTEPEADAAVTSLPNRICAVLTADCLPLLVCARNGTEVAAIHAGWRGLCAGVIESCIRQMHTNPANLLVWLGAAIGPAVYEVGQEVRAAFLAQAAQADIAFKPTRPDHWLCDLYLLAKQRLSMLGIENVYGGDFCTFSDSTRFFSHRRDGQSGRLASLIWIRSN